MNFNLLKEYISTEQSVKDFAKDKGCKAKKIYLMLNRQITYLRQIGDLDHFIKDSGILLRGMYGLKQNRRGILAAIEYYESFSSKNPEPLAIRAKPAPMPSRIKHPEPPPPGAVVPKNLYYQQIRRQRIEELSQAIGIAHQSGGIIDIDWVKEYNELRGLENQKNTELPQLY